MVAGTGALIALLWAADPRPTTGPAVEPLKPPDEQAAEADEAEEAEDEVPAGGTVPSASPTPSAPCRSLSSASIPNRSFANAYTTVPTRAGAPKRPW